MKYINEMEDYLYNHNYISENNNNVKQQELSVERASCIVQKYRTLIEEKDKLIEKLEAENMELKIYKENATRKHWQRKCSEHHIKELLLEVRIKELEKCVIDFLCTEEYCSLDGVAIADNYKEILNIIDKAKEDIKG